MLTKKQAVFLLNLVMSAAIIIATAYSAALFLSTYPATWLPYLFIIQAAVEAAIIILIAPLLDRNTYRRSFYLVIVIALIYASFTFLLHFKFYLVPFIFSALLMCITSLSPLVAWPTIRNAYDIIEFKKIGYLAQVSSAIADVVFSFGLFFFLKKYTIVSLPYFIVFFLLISLLFMRFLKPIPVIPRTSKTNIKSSAFQNSLFRILFFCSGLAVLSYILVDYCFRFELALIHDPQKIGQFMGIFTGITGIITLLINLFGLPYLLNNYGIRGLFVISPIYWIITGIVVVFYPSLMSVAFMAAGRNLFAYPALNFGRELVFNTLPSQWRTKAQFQLRSYGVPAAKEIAGLIILLVAASLGVSFIVISVLFLSIIFILYARKSEVSYINNLRQEIQLKRFDAENSITFSNISTNQKIILEMLQSPNTDVVLFALTLLQQLTLTKLPPIFFQLINSNSSDIRIEVIKITKRNAFNAMLPALLERLQVELVPEVRWRLFDAIKNLKPATVLDQAKFWLRNNLAENKIGAIRILIAAGDPAEKLYAEEEYMKILDQNDIATRRRAVQIIAEVKPDNLILELKKFIADPDTVVRINAIKAAAELRLEALIPDIVRQISQGGIYYYAMKALLQFEKKPIPFILEALNESRKNTRSNISTLVKSLARFPYTEVENYLMELAHSDDTLLRTITAREVAFRSSHVPINEDYRNQIIQLASQEIEIINALNDLEIQYPDINIQREFSSRIDMAKKRLLYWLAVEDPNEIIRLIPIILSGEKMLRARSLDLLQSLIPQKNTVIKTLEIFQGKQHFKNMSDAQKYLDSWLIQTIHGEKNMENMQKVFALRAVRLFKDLPGETLYIIGEETESVEMHKGQEIFAQGGPPTGLYIIVSGNVDIIKDKQVIARLSEGDFFGELALIDSSVRSASAVASSEGQLLFLDKETFDRIIDDLPEVLRAVTHEILHYLRQYLV